MSRTPTLQTLAFHARDHFGEDGYPFEATIPSSFDVVVQVYAHEADPEGVFRCASTALRRWLQSRSVEQADVDEFLRRTINYLRAVYPAPETARTKDEQRLLSHLFWGHLVEARCAVGGSAPHARLARSSQQQRRMAVLV